MYPQSYNSLFQCPCNHCKERCIGCHSSCVDYINAKLEYEAKKELIREMKNEEWLKRRNVWHYS